MNIKAEKIEQIIQTLNRNLLLIYSGQRDGLSPVDFRPMKNIDSNIFGHDKFAYEMVHFLKLSKNETIDTESMAGQWDRHFLDGLETLMVECALLKDEIERDCFVSRVYCWFSEKMPERRDLPRIRTSHQSSKFNIHFNFLFIDNNGLGNLKSSIKALGIKNVHTLKGLEIFASKTQSSDPMGGGSVHPGRISLGAERKAEPVDEDPFLLGSHRFPKSRVPLSTSSPLKQTFSSDPTQSLGTTNGTLDARESSSMAGLKPGAVSGSVSGDNESFDPNSLSQNMYLKQRSLRMVESIRDQHQQQALQQQQPIYLQHSFPELFSMSSRKDYKTALPTLPSLPPALHSSSKLSPLKPQATSIFQQQQLYQGRAHSPTQGQGHNIFQPSFQQDNYGMIFNKPESEAERQMHELWQARRKQEAFDWRAEQQLGMAMDRLALHKSRLESDILRRQESNNYIRQQAMIHSHSSHSSQSVSSSLGGFATTISSRPLSAGSVSSSSSSSSSRFTNRLRSPPPHMQSGGFSSTRSQSSSQLLSTSLLFSNSSSSSSWIKNKEGSDFEGSIGSMEGEREGEREGEDITSAVRLKVNDPLNGLEQESQINKACQRVVFKEPTSSQSLPQKKSTHPSGKKEKEKEKEFLPMRFRASLPSNYSIKSYEKQQHYLEYSDDEDEDQDGHHDLHPGGKGTGGGGGGGGGGGRSGLVMGSTKSQSTKSIGTGGSRVGTAGGTSIVGSVGGLNGTGYSTPVPGTSGGGLGVSGHGGGGGMGSKGGGSGVHFKHTLPTNRDKPTTDQLLRRVTATDHELKVFHRQTNFRRMPLIEDHMSYLSRRQHERQIKSDLIEKELVEKFQEETKNKTSKGKEKDKKGKENNEKEKNSKNKKNGKDKGKSETSSSSSSGTSTPSNHSTHHHQHNTNRFKSATSFMSYYFPSFDDEEKHPESMGPMRTLQLIECSQIKDRCENTGIEIDEEVLRRALVVPQDKPEALCLEELRKDEEFEGLMTNPLPQDLWRKYVISSSNGGKKKKKKKKA